MPLLTYEETRKVAPLIGEALVIGKMPSGYADPGAALT